MIDIWKAGPNAGDYQGEMNMRRTHKPLSCRVVKGALVIEIGIDTLAFAYLRSDRAFQDGSSPLSDFIDDACERAVNEGSIAFVDTKESL